MAATGIPARLERFWTPPSAIAAWFSTVDHKRIGVRYMVTAFGFFLAGGVLAMMIRTQLLVPESQFLGPQAYNSVFTMHGTTMIFLFATPFLIGLATYLMPLMLGTRDMAFPRLNALAYWTFLLSGLFLYSSFIIGAPPDGGWFNYVPLTGGEFSPGLAIDFWVLGILFVGLSTTMAAVNNVTTILKSRAVGMAAHRIPLFVWGILDASFVILIAVPALNAAVVLLALDRKLGTQFYNPAAGGDPIIWQHLFWIWGHPEVYILLLPALGILSMVFATFSRREILAYSIVVVASVAIAVLSFGLWVHHMFAVGLPLLPINLISAASFTIAIASGITIFAWIGTLLVGKLLWKTPLLFSLGFLVTFLIGGITGVMVAALPFDRQVHDSYFVVAHFHYVLVGGVVFPILAGLYYWIPKFTGRMYNEALGQISFWLVFIGFNVAFFPQHLAGLDGMPRRVYTYLESSGWGGYNLVSSIGAYVLGAGMLVFVINFLWTRSAGKPAGPDPWGAQTLEWATDSPPPPYNFGRLPIVRSLSPMWTGLDNRTGQVPLIEDPFDEGRETVVTTVLDAQPEAVVRSPGPTSTPFIMAIGLLFGFVGVLTSLLALIVAGLVIVALALATWLWEPPQAVSHARQEALVGEVRPRKRTTIPRWGILLFMISEALFFSSLLSSYSMLSGQPAEWPPAGIEVPGLVVPIILTVLILASSGTMFWADRAGRQGNAQAFRVALTASIVLAIVFLGLQSYELSRETFSLGTNAYASIFYTVTGAHGVHLLAGVLAGIWVLARSWHVPVPIEEREDRTVLSWYWHFVGAVWLLVFAELYLWVRWV